MAKRMSNEIAIKNGLVVDPLNGSQEVRNIFIKDGKIIGEKLSRAKSFNAEGLIVMPGWIDMHVHCREPGFTYKEDLVSASKAAINGGFASIVAMPNTKPVIDNPSVVSFVLEKTKLLEANIFCAGAITLGLAGEKLTDFIALKNSGAIYLTDDHNPVQDSAL